MHIRTKLILLFLLTGLLPLAILSGYYFIHVDQTIRTTREQALISLGTEVARETSRMVREGLNSILNLGENPFLTSDLSSERVADALRRTQRYHPIIRDLTLISPEGFPVNSVFYSFRGDVRATSWFHAALSGEIALSKVHAVIHPFEIVMTVALPVRDQTGGVRGVLFGQLDMEPVRQIFADLHLPATGKAVLVDERGYIVASPDRDEVLEQVAFPTLLDSMGRDSRGVHQFEQGKERIVAAYVPVGSFLKEFVPNWQVVLLEPADSAYAAANNVKTGLLIACLFSLVATVTLGLLVSRHIGDRIGKLVTATRELGRGVYDCSLDDLGKDAIGELGRTFTRTARELERSSTELKLYQENLENLVRQRTAELTGANEQLTAEIEEREKTELERRKLEEQLRQSQKMEAVGTLAGGIAHDFNNLLQAISGNVQFLLMQRKETDPDYKHLSEIDLTINRSSELVKRLLTFSRKMETRPRRLNLNKSVRNVVSLLERTIPKTISIETDLADDLPDIHADPTQMEQVLLNLAGNAVDAMPGGGILRLTTERHVFPGTRPTQWHEVESGIYIVLRVGDTGEGMDEEVRQHIFEPFYTTKEMGKGTGLGLSTVYGIIRDHGGQIDCRSETNMGSIFSVLLPVFHEDGPWETSEKLLPETDVTGGLETILVVDDEKLIRDISKDMLVRHGYTVYEAASGEEALHCFRQKKIDLVITDLGMPGMGGEELIDKLYEISPRVKIIVSTGYAGQPLKTILEKGIPYLQKPFRLNTMLRSIRETLDSRNP